MSQPIFSSARSVRFQDIDAAGIIFFAKVFEFFHDAYVECLEHHGVSLAAVLASGSWIAPIVHAESDYKSPLRFGERVTVALSGAELRERSMTIEYTIQSAERLCVTGKTAHVFIERASLRPCPIPAEIRAIFETKG
jgi:1,4-dihydroxy-2-naphthoyl-CoA hydrolase